MRLFGVMVVQNEGDIISDTLEHLRALDVYDAIFFYDLESTDDTFARALAFGDLLHDPQVLRQPYRQGLRFDLLGQHRGVFREGDWAAVLDADEFYDEDPLELIAVAETESATCLNTYQAEYALTREDLEGDVETLLSQPVRDRLRSYLIGWSEERFYKFLPDEGMFTTRQPCSRRMRNRHYPLRSPSQIQTRIATRMENRIRTVGMPGRSSWPQVYSPRWEDYLGTRRLMRQDDGRSLVFGLPPGVRWHESFVPGDPFSHMLPQVAEALQAEHAGRRNNASRTPARLTVSDRFASKVRAEIGKDMLRGRWRTAIAGWHALSEYRHATSRVHEVTV